jgi:pimeloyl-ACP methyl ester carboxylesterase
VTKLETSYNFVFFFRCIYFGSSDLHYAVRCLVSEGHGGSDGVHGYVSSLDHAVGDLKEFLEDVVLEENYGLPCFLFGHSTGGAIVLKLHFLFVRVNQRQSWILVLKFMLKV